MKYSQIFTNNHQWAVGKTLRDKQYFKELAKGQSPDHLFISCSDSRVPIEKITGAGPGDLFVHRNIANLAPNNDANSSSVIEYAIAHLQVKHISVCGHYLCGGVAAAMQDKSFGNLDPWLSHIKKVYNKHAELLDALTDEREKYNKLVELNIQEQCLNIARSPLWRKSFKAYGGPLIHGLVFDIESGILTDLNIHTSTSMEE